MKYEYLYKWVKKVKNTGQDRFCYPMNYKTTTTVKKKKNQGSEF